MRTKRFLAEVGFFRKDFLTVFLLLFNTFTWYYMTLIIMSNILGDSIVSPLFESIYYLAVVASSLVGTVVSRSMKRLSFLYLWMIFGVIASLLPALSTSMTPLYAFISLLSLGATLGVGMPSCLAYFTNSTIVENRGRLSGLIFLTANLGAIPVAIAFTSVGLTMSSWTATLWRLLGLVIFFLLKPSKKIVETRKNVSFASVFDDRPFVLYFIPWLMFSLIDRIEFPILGSFFGTEFYRSIYVAKPIIGAVFALIGGVLSDRVGRKRMVIYGFLALGLAYAAIGIAPTVIFSWYFYHIVDSIAAGILWVTCVLILWGDLSPSGASEKYYAIGNLPLFLAGAIPPFLTSYITLIPASAAFSLASFFLFTAVLPLMYAPETLPEKKMEIRRLKGYIEQAKKFTEKYTKKNRNKS